MKELRIIYIATTNDEILFGCRSKKLAEKFIKTLPEPEFIAIIETTTPAKGTMNYFGTKPINNPKIPESGINKMRDLINRTIGYNFRTHVPYEKLGIPILAIRNFSNFKLASEKKECA